MSFKDWGQIFATAQCFVTVIPVSNKSTTMSESRHIFRHMKFAKTKSVEEKLVCGKYSQAIGLLASYPK